MSDPAATLAQVAGRFMRLAARALAVVLALGIVLEATFRLLGGEPQNLYRTGLVSATVPDGWTGWGMRPGVRYNEYTVTNAYGLHEDREIAQQKPAGVKRIAVVGSSVVWGLGQEIGDTIPRAAEVAMRRAGCTAQVLNFAGIGFNILNTSAFVQTKVHQFEPDAIVVVMDLQMGFPRFPVIQAGLDPSANIKTLGTLEGWFKRATEYSVVLTALDDVAWARGRLKDRQPLAVEVPQPAKKAGAKPADDYGPRQLQRFLDRLEGGVAALFKPLKNTAIAGRPGAVAAVEPFPARAPVAPSVAEFEARRARELGSLVAAMSAFARRMGIRIYFVTPYGPYFHTTPAELKLYSLNMLAEAARVYGSLDAALRRETEIASEIVAREAAREGAGVIDMLPASREATMASGDFSSDGIHFAAQGYRRVGELVAQRLLADGICR